MSKPELREGEEFINHWTLNFRPSAGGRFTGKLYVTNQRVIFDAEHNNSSMLAALMDQSFQGHGVLSVEFANIQEVLSEKSLLKKSVILHVDSGDQFNFDYGMLSVDKIVETLKTQLNSAVDSSRI